MFGKNYGHLMSLEDDWSGNKMIRLNCSEKSVQGWLKEMIFKNIRTWIKRQEWSEK